MKTRRFLFGLFIPIICTFALLSIVDIRPSQAEAPQLTVNGPIIIDHTSVALFDHIPAQYLGATRNIPMLFSDRSVGANIHQGLDCLAAGAWYEAPAHCRRDYYDSNGSSWFWKTYGRTDYENGLVPDRILFEPDPQLYNRSNWTFEFQMGTWDQLLDNFASVLVPAYTQGANEKDVLSFQFSYINIEDGSTIADPQQGFFVDLPHNGTYPTRERWDISDMEALEAQYPDKVFIYWTTSLARSIGTDVGTDFNNQMRAYAQSNNKVLFDFADIESHDDRGVPCYDNRDGVQFCMNGNCENHPNDGRNIPAICSAYTTETDGGHLGSVSAGKIRLVKAFWVLMARIAGWDGQVDGPGPSPTPTNPPLPTATMLPTDVPTTLPPTPTDPPARNTPVPTQIPTEIPTETPTELPTELPTVVPTPTEPPAPTATPPLPPTPLPIPVPGGTIFDDGFESGNLAAWSSARTGGGALQASSEAAIAGNFGLVAAINNNRPIYVESDHPNAESSYKLSFSLDTASLQMREGDGFAIARAYAGGTDAYVIYLSYKDGGFNLEIYVKDDGGRLYRSGQLPITPGVHDVVVDWGAASGAARNGSILMWIDSSLQFERNNLDNDSHRVERVRLGAVGGVDSGTRGEFCFDNFKSER